MQQVSIKRQINKELDILPVNLQKAGGARNPRCHHVG
jgi:hypothetical protein